MHVICISQDLGDVGHTHAVVSWTLPLPHTLQPLRPLLLLQQVTCSCLRVIKRNNYFRK